MKTPFNSNYELMKLPYSHSEFPSHLTSDPVIPTFLFNYEPIFPHGDSVYMLWPSSWNYPDGFLRDAFGFFACFPEQAYISYAAMSEKMKSDIEIVIIREGFKKKEISEALYNRLINAGSDVLKKTKRFFTLPYSFHEFNDFNDSLKIPYFFRHDAFTQESQGPEIYCLKKEVFDEIKDQEYTFETRILPTFQYFPALLTDFLKLGPTDQKTNRQESEERTEEVLKKNEKRRTPMKPLW